MASEDEMTEDTEHLPDCAIFRKPSKFGAYICDCAHRKLLAENEKLRADYSKANTLIGDYMARLQISEAENEKLRDWQRRAKRKLEDYDGEIQDLGAHRDEAVLQLIAEAEEVDPDEAMNEQLFKAGLEFLDGITEEKPE